MTLLSIVVSIASSYAGSHYEPDVPAAVWPEFMRRHDMLWTVLPGDWTESAFLGNGLHGTAVFGDVDGGLRWDVGRHDVVDYHSRIAIGRFVMPPVGPPDGFRMRLHLWNAEVTGEWEGTDGTLSWRTLTHASDPVTMIELSGPEVVRDQPIRFIQEPPIDARALFGKIEELGKGRKPWSTIKDPKVLAEIARLAAKSNPSSEKGTSDSVHWCRQPLKRGGGYTVAWGERLLDNGKRLFAFTVDYEQKDAPGSERAVRDVKAALAAQQDEWIQRHRDWWHAYYRRSFLSIPDTRMESFYWIQMYKLAAATRADRPAIDLMGPWTYRTPWPRIWWNLNIQLTYWPVYAANRLSIGESLVRMIDNGRKNLIDNVPNEEWRKDSAGIGRTSIWDCSSRVGKEPGNLTFALHNYWLHCRYEGGDERLKDGLFPILKRSVGYYLHTLKEGPDSKLHTPLGISPEYKIEAEDTNYDLSLLRWGLQTLLAINERLQLNDPLAAKWQSTLDRLTPFPVDPATGYRAGDRNAPRRGVDHPRDGVAELDGRSVWRRHSRIPRPPRRLGGRVLSRSARRGRFPRVGGPAGRQDPLGADHERGGQPLPRADEPGGQAQSDRQESVHADNREGSRRRGHGCRSEKGRIRVADERGRAAGECSRAPGQTDGRIEHLRPARGRG